MLARKHFTEFEGFSILATTFLFHVFSGMLPSLSATCGNAVWIAEIIGIALSIGQFFLYYLLYKMHEGKNLLQINEAVLGKAAGRFVNFLLMLYFMLYCINNLVEGVEILAMNTYTNTRTIVLVLAFLVVVYVISHYPIMGLAKSTSILVPVFFISIAFILIMSANQYDVNYLFPILGYGVKPLAYTSFIQLASFDGLLILGVFMQSFSSLKAFKKSGLWAVILSGISFFCSAFFYNMAVPYQVAKYKSAGLLDLAQSIYINRFFQRLESVFIIFVSMGKILAVCIAFLAVKKMFCHIFSIPAEHHNRISFPLILLTLCSIQFLFNSNLSKHLVSRFMNHYSVYFTISFLLIVLLGSFLRKFGKGRRIRVVSALLVLVFVAGIFTGCNPIAEPDEEVYTVVMGYDKSDSETLRITMKIMPEDKNSAGGEGGGDFTDSEGSTDSGQTPENVFVVDAPCNLPAADLISTVMPKHISLLHVKMLVISEELAREDVDMLITSIVRYNEIKSSIALVICAGKAQDFIAAKTSNLIPFLPLETEMILKTNKGNSSYLVRTMSEVYNDYAGNYGDALVMYGGINGTEMDRKFQQEVKEQKGLDESGHEQEDGGQGDGESGGDSTNPPSNQSLGGMSAPSAPTGSTGEDSGEGSGEENQPISSFEPTKPDPIDEDERQYWEENLHNDEFGQIEPGGASGGTMNRPDIYYDAQNTGYLQGYLPGEVPVQTSIEQQLAGMAVMRGSQMVGTINTHETAMYLLADGGFHAVLALQDMYIDDYYIMLNVNTRQPTKVRTRIDDDGIAHIDIEAFVRAEPAIIHNSVTNYKATDENYKLRKYTEEYIETEVAQLIEKTQQEFESDIFRLGRYVAHNFKTIDEWETYDWRNKYKDAEITFKMNVKM